METAPGPFWVQRFDLPSGQSTVTLLGPEGAVLPVERFLRALVALGRSPNTCRAFAHDLCQWFSFLYLRKDSWDKAPLSLIPQWIFQLRYGSQIAAEKRIIPLRPEEQLTAKTINRKLSAIYKFYLYHDHTRLAGDLFRWIEVSGDRSSRFPARPFHLREPKNPPHVLSASQLESIKDACQTCAESLLVGFLGERGMRIGQALGLRHEDISVRELTYTIVPRTDNINLVRAKTKEPHTLPLTKKLARLYTRYLVDEYGSFDCDYVFVNFDGKRRQQVMNYDDARNVLGGLSQRSGVVFTPHTLRHTWATLEAAKGTPLHAIQRMLCHKDPATTSDTYLHLTVDDLRRVIDNVINGVKA